MSCFIFSFIKTLKLIFLTFILDQRLLYLSISVFCANFSLNNIVFCTFLSNSLIMANPDILTINDASTFINFCSLGLIPYVLLGVDLFRKQKQQSHAFITPSNSDMFLMPNTMSTFSRISDTNVYISNLCPWISKIIGTMNKTLTNSPFPTLILYTLDANFGSEWSDLQCK